MLAKKASYSNKRSQISVSCRNDLFFSRLEKSKKDNQTILQRFRAMKAACDKKGKIVQVNMVFADR